MNDMAAEINVISEQISSKSCSVDGKEAGKSHHKAKTRVKKTEQDFIFGKVIGDGSFSTVYLAKDRTTGTEFAAKVCMKAHIQKEKKVQNVMREKEIMNRLNENEAEDTPFFVKLAYTFQTERDLYFILSYCQYGEFLQLIKQVGNFDYDSARFYTGEIIKGLEHLHSLNIVHRDLKPENILLDEKMHIKISDFGSAKILNPADNSDEASNSLGFLRSSSFVGTAQYVSPEVLTEKKVCLASDLWSLGCVIYQIVSGLPPFRNESEYLIFQKIQQLNYEFPPGFFETAKDMVKKLLVLNAADRLGSNDKAGHYSHLRKHSFLCDLDLDVLYQKEPPIITTYTPESEDNEELWKEVTEPGLEGREIELLSKMITNTTNFKPNKEKPKSPAARKVSHHLAKLHLSLDEREKLLQDQEKNNKWHKFVEGNLILRQGLLDKRKGLFPRRRMFLLTTGPHLYYVDPVNNVLKGEVPYGPTTMPEGKNFKTFFVHTPNRTYYLEDPTNSSQQWMQAIEELRDYYFTQ